MDDVLMNDPPTPEMPTHDVPKLLIEWPSPWREFLDSIRPALSRSPAHLAGEARTGIFPYRGMLSAWVFEAVLLIAVIVLPAKLAHMHPFAPPALPKYDVIYYSGNELPRMEDRGGARGGRSGRAGGSQGHHPTQTIRVARGEMLREQVVDAPKLNLPEASSQVANLLSYKSVPGTPPTSGLSSLRTPDLKQAAVAPPPEIQRDRMQVPVLSVSVVPPIATSPQRITQKAPALNQTIVPPSANSPQREIAAFSVPGSNTVQVIPPPVSAPEQTTDLHPRLTLPQRVVAPPPTQIAHDLRSTGPGFDSGELRRQVVAPTVQVSGDSIDRRTVGGLGNAPVVAPPVQLTGGDSIDRRGVSGIRNSQVVAPPVQVTGTAINDRQVAGVGTTAVPPPAQVQSGFWRSLVTAVTGTAAVPPPPTLTANAGTGVGSGTRGSGFGEMVDAGAPAPGKTGGNVAGNGIIVSNAPGSKVATPSTGGAGSLAMSPSGGAKSGLGGSDNGSGIGKGNGSGNSASGAGSGAARSGSGHDTGVLARAGTSPLPGTGGAGIGASNPPLPGVSVHGGSNIITLPSFGSADSPSDPAVSSIKRNHAGPDITIVGSSRAGGAFNLYGALKGDKVYTIYIDTTLGTAVMEYADPTSATHPYGEDLTAPQPVLADLPAHLKRTRLVIACVLDRSGALKNTHVLQSGGPEMTNQVLAYLAHWKFSPAFRGDQPVEVNAILGFDIDTN